MGDEEPWTPRRIGCAVGAGCVSVVLLSIGMLVAIWVVVVSMGG